MSPTSFSTSAETRDEIADYIIVLDDYRAEELGKVYKAFDKQRRTQGRYVALLRLHPWCLQLPPPTFQTLQAAVQAAQAKQDDNLLPAAFNYVSDFMLDLPASTTAQIVAYIVTPWVEEISLEELFSKHLEKPSEAVTFVYALGAQLQQIYAQSSYLRPLIALKQVRHKPEAIGRESIVLDGWRFETVLDEKLRESAQEHEAVNRLASLLLHLLEGIWLCTGNRAAAATQELLHEQLLKDEILKPEKLLAVEEKFTQPVAGQPRRAKIWPLLERFLMKPSDQSPLTLAHFVTEFAEYQELAEPLNDVLNPPANKVGDAGSSVPTASTNGQTLSTDGQSVDKSTQVEEENRKKIAQAQHKQKERYDRLQIYLIREQIRYGQNLYRIDQATAPGTKPLKDIYVIGEAAPDSAIYHLETGEPLKKPEIFAALQQCRLYLQRHLSQEAGQNFYYYTAAVLGYNANGHVIRFDQQRISPLFAILLTPKSTLEVVQDYRIELVLAGAPTPGSWTTAKAQGLVALTVHEQRFTVAPDAQSLVVPLTVTNPTEKVDRLTVVVDGMPPDWPLPTPIQYSLLHEESIRQTLTIPLPAFRTRGTHEFTIRLISDNVSAQVAAATIYVTVPSQTDFAGYLHPQAVRVGDVGEIVLQNYGNFDQDFFITLRDQANELLFEPTTLLVTIQARQEGSVGYRAYARQWRFLGGVKRHEVTVLVAPQQGGLPKPLTGQVHSRALIPLWTLLVLAFLLVSVGLLFSFLFTPEFVQTAISASGAPVTAAIAGQEVKLHWTSLNTCLYSLYQNDRALVWRDWQRNALDRSHISGLRYSRSVARTNVGDKLELRLYGCTFFPSKSWQVEVLPPPTGTPPPPPLPVIDHFTLAVQGLPPLQVDQLGRVIPVVSQPQTVTPLLVGQQGELCLQWRVTGMASTGFKMQITPLLGEITEAEGERCLPIATTFPKAQAPFAFVLQILNDAGEEVAARALPVQITNPSCYVNVEEPLYLREGPGRAFPDRGQLGPDAVVLPLARPFFPHDQPDAARWSLVTLPSDPRPVWIAYDYLRCPVDIWVLPDAPQIPATPTPTPTVTPEPTVTPTPESKPEVVITPEVIPLGGCAIFKWKIQNVKTVYLNEEGVVGEAEKTICPTEAGQHKYTWRIEDKNGVIVQIERTLIVNPAAPVAPTPPQ